MLYIYKSINTAGYLKEEFSGEGRGTSGVHRSLGRGSAPAACSLSSSAVFGRFCLLSQSSQCLTDNAEGPLATCGLAGKGASGAWDFRQRSLFCLSQFLEGRGRAPGMKPLLCEGES